MAEARRGFTVPPEVPRYFADKNLSPRFSWLDVFGEEHAYSHTVAKATELELLGAFQKSIQTALEKGQGFENWRDNLRPELERLGWWKPRRVADPEGRLPDALVDFSSPRRLKTIFWSNMRSARAAGQWERIQRTKKALPYLLYVRTTSAEPRPEHLTWAGLILPVDDPFWNSHMPPNGWMCKCAVRQITAREAEKKIATGNYLTEAQPMEMVPFVNRRTGQIVKIPKGIDPGWHTNPGLARAQTLMDGLSRRLESAGEAAAKQTIAEFWRSPSANIYMGLPERVSLPAGMSTAIQSELQAKSPLIMISTDTVRVKSDKHANFGLHRAAKIQKMIDEGDIVDEERGDDQRTVLLNEGKQVWKVVITKSRGGYLRVSTVHEISAKRAARLRNGGRRP